MKDMANPDFMNQMQNDPMFKSLLNDPRVNGLFDVSITFTFDLYIFNTIVIIVIFDL